ncbi:cystathionine gamma-synthase [Shewanella sp. 202IG2-18]|uniref:cystathionine gamma-synthase n=1 Tax=Parashewanella hymeniacidonis TaxID=2807618 RepID=UPI00195FF6C3|nr:cystathionine gamma-synthase [Parashewanella hymeniacidonis]
MKSTTTIAVRNGLETDIQYGSVVPPMHLSTNYCFDDALSPREFDYSRSGNPTRALLADTLAKLEKGAGAIITNTGMSAITLVLQLLKPHDLLIVPHDSYGGSLRLFKAFADKGCFKLDIIDQTQEEQIQSAIAKEPKMVWLETPSNPLLRIVDIQKIANKLEGSHTLLVVDNTFLSPLLQKPLSLGADIIVHSTTKYINGHSDVVGGAVIAKTDDLSETLCWWGNTLGLTGGAFDAYQTLRGVRTLPIRIKQHEQNAKKVVNILSEHHAVSQLYYPGLENHIGHEIAKRQQSGFGGMVSFELKGDHNALIQFVHRLQLFSLAESLGGVESLVCVPALMTHRSMDNDAQVKAGIKPTLIRLSIGVEDGDDLATDLKQALDTVLLGDKD